MEATVSEQTDHAKRLAEIEGRVAEQEDEEMCSTDIISSWAHHDRGWLLAQHRAASEVLTALGVPEGCSLAERIQTAYDLGKAEHPVEMARRFLSDENDEPTAEDRLAMDAAATRAGGDSRAAVEIDPAKELERLAADPALRAAFNAYPGEAPRIIVAPHRGAVLGEFRQEHGIPRADLARALCVSVNDIIGLEMGNRTTDDAGWREIQTTLFLLGSGKKAEHIAEPMSDPSFWKALESCEEDEPEPVDPADGAGPQTDEDRAAVERVIARSCVDEEEAWIRVLEDRGREAAGQDPSSSRRP
jgi:hypothetical protein